MTNKSSTWNINDRRNKPFLLRPSGKDYLWGGNRLKDDFSKDLDLFPLAETWECSTHPDGPSTVVSGKYKGQLLTVVLQQHPEYIGTHPHTKGELPILIKMIDAKKNLSIQVHPNDEYAMKYENGQLGKTEMWYVLDAAKDSSLIYGLCQDTDMEILRKSIQKGSFEKYLRKVAIKKGDVFYIEAGMIHAIGAGALVVEIQENSNLTYRLYDYNRVDKNGKKRELHIDKALEAANLHRSEEPVQPMRVLQYRQGCVMEFLCRCKYFQVERMLLNTECCREMLSFQTTGVSFEVLLCLNGCGSILYDEEMFQFVKGDCIFIPANSVLMKIHGKAEFLKVSC